MSFEFWHHAQKIWLSSNIVFIGDLGVENSEWSVDANYIKNSAHF